MYIRKYLVILGICSMLIFTGLCVLNTRRGVIASPFGGRYVTIFRPVSLFWENEFYVIPYNYDGFFAPKSNFAVIKPTGFSYLNVNWKPNDPRMLKIDFSSGYIINNFDTSKFVFAIEERDFLDNGDFFYYPKYMSYTLADILQ